jgi:RNA polymerase sigma-70 factor (ECF subfamily)
MVVFVIACRRFDAIPAGAELPWLLGSARRVLANQRRGERRAQALVNGCVNLSAWRRSSQSRGTSSLQRVSDRDREVLLLSVWEELSPQELGVALGCSRAAAAVRLRRARRRSAAAYTRVRTGALPDRRTEVAR